MGAILTACCVCNIWDKRVLCNAKQKWQGSETGPRHNFCIFSWLTYYSLLWTVTDHWLSGQVKSGQEAGVYPPKARSCNFVEGAEKWFCMDQIAVITTRHITIYTEVSLLVTADCQLEACIKTEWMIKRSLMWLPKNVEKKFIVRNVKIQ